MVGTVADGSFCALSKGPAAALYQLIVALTMKQHF